MIISASRRTDIPAYYPDWFLNRVKAGFVCVRNPMNYHQISRVSLSPDVVDAIVFWTKNPLPMLNMLDELRDYTFYFQFTLNSYGEDVERNVPSKSKVIVPAFQRLSDLIGPERVIWRYDPIFLNETYTVDYHLRYFEELAKRLSPYTRKCTFSFLDLYDKTERNMRPLSARTCTLEEQSLLAKAIAEIAHGYGLTVDTCAEGIDLRKYGIEHARCIDDRLLSRLLQCPLNVKKDKNQRPECGCVESVDIGAYNTCGNGCRYCYANFNDNAVSTNQLKHDPTSPLLLGEIESEDKVTEHKAVSCKVDQIQLEL